MKRSMEMGPKVKERWLCWEHQELEDLDLREELKEIKDDEEAILDRFYQDLKFGTGGMRGVIGVGTNRMNLYTVAKASQGYANHLNRRLDGPSLVIAYDSRIKSDYFAKIAAEVFAANGISVSIFRELMPTPVLSFAVRYLGCSGGVVVTASHNPSKYNGYKVYGADGCQITTDAAKEIQGEIDDVDLFEHVKRMDFDEAVSEGMIQFISEELIASYIDQVLGQALSREEEIDRQLSIVYTPLNGAGLSCVTRCLCKGGFHNFVVVKEQEEPDGCFPTCPYPNPEVGEAMELGIAYARERNSDIVLATDPDCDRVGIAVRDQGGEYVLLSGNETGVLLLNYICMRRTSSDRMPERPLAFKTIVTTDMAERIGMTYGVQIRNVLTGFKFIGEQIGFLEKKGELDRFIFGFEESYGYLSGGYVRDKDGVNASYLICEMAAYYKRAGKSLMDVLDELYAEYGYCLNTQHSYQFEGVGGHERMLSILEGFHRNGFEPLGGRKVFSISDYGLSKKICRDGCEEKMDFPKSNVIKLELEDSASVIIRPSGTEPKIKIYFSVNAETRDEAVDIEKQLAKEVEQRIFR